MTRCTRENLIKGYEEKMPNLATDLVHEEVIDLAVKFHGTLSVIASKYSCDAIVDLIPDLTIALNKLDASIKVNSDLKTYLADLTEESKVLKNKLEVEKDRRKQVFEDSLVSEEKADEEISSYRKTVASLQENIELITDELKTRDSIINQLRSDCSELTAKLSVADQTSKLNSEFRTPKNPARKIWLTTGPPINVENQFSVLSECSSETPPTSNSQPKNHQPTTSTPLLASSSITPPRHLIQSNTLLTTKKRKVLVMADSQGIEMNKYLDTLQNDFEVFVLSKPGATLKQVVRAGIPLFKDFSMKDYVICMAGTNDLGKHEPSQLSVHTGLVELLSVKVKTNIIINELPYRYDACELNDNIYFLNQKIKSLVKSHRGYSRVSLCSTNDILRRNHFTKHGLHFNKHGKRTIGNFYIQCIRYQVDKADLPNHQKPTQQQLNHTQNSILLQPSKNQDSPIQLTEEDMSSLIQKHRHDKTIAFAHSISSDFEDNRRMSAGVAVVFAKNFRKPHPIQRVTNHLAVQNTLQGAAVYSLITKAKYWGKPIALDYNMAFEDLTTDFKRRGLTHLICSPVGCVRDHIHPELFVANLKKFQYLTGATIVISSYAQESQRSRLRRGLTHEEFNKVLLGLINRDPLPHGQVSPSPDNDSPLDRTPPTKPPTELPSDEHSSNQHVPATPHPQQISTAASPRTPQQSVSTTPQCPVSPHQSSTAVSLTPTSVPPPVSTKCGESESSLERGSGNKNHFLG